MKVLLSILSICIISACTHVDSHVYIAKVASPIPDKDDQDFTVGSFKIISYCSKKNIDYRKISTYFPNKNYESDIYIYFPDGGNLHDIALDIDKLIYESSIRPINLIGVYPKERFQEYVYNDKYSQVFNDHFQLFTDEIPNKFEAKSSLIKRHIIGFSNGADFANYVGIHKPDWIESVVAMSGVAYFPDLLKVSDSIEVTYPNFYLTSGSEESLEYSNTKFQKALLSKGATVHYQQFQGGHQYELWKNQLIQHIVSHFGMCS